MEMKVSENVYTEKGSRKDGVRKNWQKRWI